MTFSGGHWTAFTFFAFLYVHISFVKVVACISFLVNDWTVSQYFGWEAVMPI